jgi:hypothetical protein
MVMNRIGPDLFAMPGKQSITGKRKPGTWYTDHLMAALQAR